MTYKQNLHTHTTFCDGKDSPEELAAEAVLRGFDSLGFSIHSFMRRQTVDSEKLEAYKSDVLRVKQKYKNELDIFLGVEYEPWTEFSPKGFDYSIAAVHYLETADGYRTFDVDLAGTLDFVNTYFGGDSMKFAKAYYQTLAALPEKGAFDILAHFDIITKHNEKHPFIDVDSKEYLRFVYEAADALMQKIPFFELNTGAIGRAYRSAPYPALPILKELRQRGSPWAGP